MLELFDAAYWAAIAAGAFAAGRGNRTAYPLLASALVAKGLDLAGVPFILPLWVAIDLATAAAIWRLVPHRSRLDWTILALFLPAWGFYLAPELPRYLGAGAVVIAQLALTVPAALRR